MAQVKVTFFFPALPSSKLPQSLQKIREPIADMVVDFVVVNCEVGCGFRKKVTGNRKAQSSAESRHSRACSTSVDAVGGKARQNYTPMQPVRVANDITLTASPRELTVVQAHPWKA
jgi:hypothetical protein